MKKVSRKIISVLLIIPLFSIMTFCCCLEKDADASAEHVAMWHHQELEKSYHPFEHQHHHSKDQDECSCPHLSFIAEQPFEIIPNLFSFPLAKNFLAVPSCEIVLLSSSSLQSQGPPGQDHRDQVAIPLFLKNSNLRI